MQAFTRLMFLSFIQLTIDFTSPIRNDNGMQKGLNVPEEYISVDNK